jgi:hypothetical protein
MLETLFPETSDAIEHLQFSELVQCFERPSFHEVDVVSCALNVNVHCAIQFYLTESDLGHPRAAACCAKLAELNP